MYSLEAEMQLHQDPRLPSTSSFMSAADRERRYDARMNQALIIIDIQNDYFPGGKMELVGGHAASGSTAREPAMIRPYACIAILVASWAGLLQAQPTASVNPRLQEIRRIHVSIGLTHGTGKEFGEQLVSRLAGSGRFVVVEKSGAADANLVGRAGSTKSEKDGQKFVTGFANLRLIDPKTSEIIWTFEYRKGKGDAARAADRVADQFIEKLLADAGTADHSVR